MTVEYRIYIEVEKHTFDDRLDNDTYEDVTDKFTDWAASFVSADPSRVKRVAAGMHRFGQEEMPS